MSFAARFGWVAPACGMLLLGVACDRKGDEAVAVASASASVFKPAAPVASGLPGANDRISKAVNPDNKPAYAGPTGIVRGVITATGDVAPVATAHLQQIKGDCPEAREIYGHLFREGMLRSLADVLVAVTGYEGYVPAKEPKQLIAARGCAFSTRTVALTFGQTLEIVSKDREAYVPNLLGSRMKAQLLALPGGAGSTVYPPEPGHYLLTDDIKLFMMADVFVVKYSTHDVTGLDGKYEIAGIPVGKARISALLPATGAVVERDIEVKADTPLELPLALPFDAKAAEAKAAEARRLAALASASAAASAPPAPSSAAPR
jgi:hypothetical protein